LLPKKTTSPAEYRKKSRKIVELPSGAVFEIRKLSPLVYGAALEKMGVKADTSPDSAESVVRENIFELMKTVVPKCVMSPKVAVDPVSEDELDYEDIELADLTMLLDEIYKFSGLSVQAQEEREEFREVQTG